RSLKRSSAWLLNLACAYGGLLFRTVHVLVSFLGFVPAPSLIMSFRQVEHDYGGVVFSAA
ncbi:hypothetical protein OA785_25010, partial [Citrobacter freundii]